MKNLKLTIEINKPARDIFAFTLNPKNTPKWIDFIAVEETNEWPVKLGTIYRNRADTNTEWSDLKVTEFEQDKRFALSKKDGSFHVRYVLTPVATDTTRLDYYEWTDNGELGEPFTIEPLQKLKRIIEGEHIHEDQP
jgi:hypothetical protein